MSPTCWPGVLTPFQKTWYHLNEFSSWNYSRTAQKLFNLRHSSLRVTVERAFGALKNRFRILDHKPFHTFPTQVKLVLACCILHNWILQWCYDELVSEEEDVTVDDVVSSSHGVEAFDNEAWKNKRMEWAQAMWKNRGKTRIRRRRSNSGRREEATAVVVVEEEEEEGEEEEEVEEEEAAVATEEEEEEYDEDGLSPSSAPINFPLLSHMTFNLYCYFLVARMNCHFFPS